MVEYLGRVDLDLGSCPGWWAATVATYCSSRMVEHPKSKSTQPRYSTTRVTLYKVDVTTYYSTDRLICSPSLWAVLQLPCCPSKQREFSENILQNLQNKLPPHTVPSIVPFTVGEYCKVCKHGVNAQLVLYEGQLRKARDVEEEKRIADEERRLTSTPTRRTASRVAIQ